jgi:hypothetical protein
MRIAVESKGSHPVTPLPWSFPTSFDPRALQAPPSNAIGDHHHAETAVTHSHAFPIRF